VLIERVISAGVTPGERAPDSTPSIGAVDSMVDVVPGIETTLTTLSGETIAEGRPRRFAYVIGAGAVVIAGLAIVLVASSGGGGGRSEQAPAPPPAPAAVPAPEPAPAVERAVTQEAPAPAPPAAPVVDAGGKVVTRVKHASEAKGSAQLAHAHATAPPPAVPDDDALFKQRPKASDDDLFKDRPKPTSNK